MRTRSALLSAVLMFCVFPLFAQEAYTTGFEQPSFLPGDVDGQNGWGHLSNSPTGGAIEPVPPGSPAEFGAQSLAIRTRNADFLGVANHLFSPTIDPPAGETGATAGGVVADDPRSHFSASLWFRTPSSPVISTRTDGRFAELNPSSKGNGPDTPANRYAQVRLVSDAGGQVRVEIGWYTSTTFEVRTVAMLDWGAWYRFDYSLHLADGLAGTEPNDRFTLTIFDASGAQAGTACGSTWELAWKSGSFGGGTSPRAVNGFDFSSVSGPNGNLAGHVDNLTMTAFDGASLGVTITGSSTARATLTADVTGGSGTIASYTWRNAANDIVGNEATYLASPGTYTVTVADSSCDTATSLPFVVGLAPAGADVPTISNAALAAMLVLFAAIALLRLR